MFQFGGLGALFGGLSPPVAAGLYAACAFEGPAAFCNKFYLLRYISDFFQSNKSVLC